MVPTYVALTIKVVEPHMQRIVEFDGIVTEIRADDDVWTIGDREVTVTEHTVIQGTIVVGDRVKVRAYRTDEGDLVALLIKKAGASWWPKMERFSGAIVSLPETRPIGDGSSRMAPRSHRDSDALHPHQRRARCRGHSPCDRMVLPHWTTSAWRWRSRSREIEEDEITIEGEIKKSP